MAGWPSERSGGDHLVVHHHQEQEAESDLSSLVYDMSQKVHMAMENMLKMINEIDQNVIGIKEEIEKCKESAVEKKRILQEDKEKFQKDVYTVLDMLNGRG